MEPRAAVSRAVPSLRLQMIGLWVWLKMWADATQAPSPRVTEVLVPPLSVVCRAGGKQQELSQHSSEHQEDTPCGDMNCGFTVNSQSLTWWCSGLLGFQDTGLPGSCSWAVVDGSGAFVHLRAVQRGIGPPFRNPWKLVLLSWFCLHSLWYSFHLKQLLISSSTVRTWWNASCVY